MQNKAKTPHEKSPFPQLQVDSRPPSPHDGTLPSIPLQFNPTNSAVVNLMTSPLGPTRQRGTGTGRDAPSFFSMDDQRCNWHDSPLQGKRVPFKVTIVNGTGKLTLTALLTLSWLPRNLSKYLGPLIPRF